MLASQFHEISAPSKPSADRARGSRALDERLAQATERRLEAKEHVFCEGDARTFVYRVEEGVIPL